MKKLGGLVLIVVGGALMFASPLAGIAVIIVGLVVTWQAEVKS